MKMRKGEHHRSIHAYYRYHSMSDLGESDLVTVDKAISTFWCEGQDLWMNATFHAYLLDEEPTISEDIQHFEMDKEKGGEIKVEFHSGEKQEKEEVSLANHKKEFGLKKPTQNQVIVQTVVFAQNIAKGKSANTTEPTPPNKRKKYRLKSNKSNKNNSTTPHSIREKRAVKAMDDEDGYEYVDSETNGEDDVNDDTDAGNDGGEEEEDGVPMVPNPVGVEPDDMDDNSNKKSNNNNKKPLLQATNNDDEEIDEQDIRSSGSSFAKNLWTCYGGDTLFTQSFTPSPKCNSQDSMMKYAVRMRTVHEITSTGYYYYIFYSDNDVVSNTIYAKFEINKVLYQLQNFTQSCLNATHCSLPLNFMSTDVKYICKIICNAVDLHLHYIHSTCQL